MSDQIFIPTHIEPPVAAGPDEKTFARLALAEECIQKLERRVARLTLVCEALADRSGLSTEEIDALVAQQKALRSVVHRCERCGKTLQQGIAKCIYCGSTPSREKNVLRL